MRVPLLKPWVDRWRARAWPELPVLVAIVLIAALSWGFVELADEVLGGDTQHFDQAVIGALRDPVDPRLPRGPAWLADTARDITALGSPAVLALTVVVVTGYLAMLRRWRTIAVLLAAVLSGAILTTLLKQGFGRERPPAGSALQGTHSLSFPSGHSLSAALVYLTLGAMLARVMPTWKLHLYFIGMAILVAILIGCTRVYLGVHYPTDVLAGWAVGAAWALWWWLIARWTIRSPEPDAELLKTDGPAHAN
jgi:undecaprenyl-diphosphatase